MNPHDLTEEEINKKISDLKKHISDVNSSVELNSSVKQATTESVSRELALLEDIKAEKFNNK